MRCKHTADIRKGKQLTMGVQLLEGVWHGICLPLFDRRVLNVEGDCEKAMEALCELVCRRLEELCMEAETLCKRSINAKS